MNQPDEPDWKSFFGGMILAAILAAGLVLIFWPNVDRVRCESVGGAWAYVAGDHYRCVQPVTPLPTPSPRQ